MVVRIALYLEKGVKYLCSILNWVCVILLFVLMVHGAADVIGRYFFNKPIIGTLERGEIIMATMVFLGWGYTQLMRGHVNVELVLSRLSRKSQAIANLVTSFVSLIIFILMAWRAAITSIYYGESGRSVYVIGWPLAPFQMLITVGSVVLCFVLIRDLVYYYLQVKRGEC